MLKWLVLITMWIMVMHLIMEAMADITTGGLLMIMGL
ncbi:hypothetical protein UFOVP330_13 [uncultured Caudovirales phage]|uniref:Uncharacterized protein n=1 Tax=uncultured Caudovirales phage TaxID=2100421 RepID=A0A6J5M342_9CAUD|nr:hypothetical protein UFOVP330_13 [uncultured Caudovirales phage]